MTTQKLVYYIIMHEESESRVGSAGGECVCVSAGFANSRV